MATPTLQSRWKSSPFVKPTWGTPALRAVGPAKWSYEQSTGVVAEGLAKVAAGEPVAIVREVFGSPLTHG